MDEVPTPTLIDSLKTVLDNNWQGSFTIPAEGLYPHQWLWDSCFVAIGLANYDTARAQTELRSLLRGQWANGMLPHMIFSSKSRSSTDSRIWQAWRNPNSPDDVQTTGMTQPPLLAEAVTRIGQKMHLRDRRSWYQDMYPALVAHHEWLYRDRDPHDEGLVLLIHPWESGLDNSPPWISQLHMHGKPTWISLVEKTKLDTIFLLFRRDTQHVPPGQRLNTIDALLYYNVLQRLRRKNWDIEAILSRSHFMVEDLAFNCILIRANHLLRDIAKTIGHELPEPLITRMKKTEEALDKLWDGYYNEYFSRNFVTHKLIKKQSLATLLPLYAGTISPQRAQELVSKLHDAKLFDTDYPVASVPVSSPDFSELGYWQGPTWLNTNWLLVDGLKRYGFDNEAKRIIEKSCALVEAHGPYEYFSALNGDPAGAHNFSWTAALAIDFLYNS